MRKRGRITTVLVAAAVAALVAGGTGSAANRTGTWRGETLVGTHRADRIEGKGGDDLLKGLAGNDVYVFKNGWGADTLVDKARYEVDGTWRPGGVDTLDFSAVTDHAVSVSLVPQWGPEANKVGYGEDQVALGRSAIENVVGGASLAMEFLTGGGQDNTLRPGGGKCDTLGDVGGWPDGLYERPGLRASNDTYTGLTANTDTVNVADWGGADDVVDLRPLQTADVDAVALDLDADPGTAETLMIVTGPESEVVLYGQLGEHLWDDGTGTPKGFGYQGLIEKLVFADRVVDGADALDVLGGAESAAARSADAGGDRDREERAREARVRKAAAQLPTPAELAGRR